MPQNYSDCPRVAKHTLILGPSGHVQPDSSVLAQPNDFINSAHQSDSLQEYVEPKPTCLAPTASTFKKQGFSEADAARIKVPQRGSTRLVYEAKWSIFTKCCSFNKTGFFPRNAYHE